MNANRSPILVNTRSIDSLHGDENVVDMSSSVRDASIRQFLRCPSDDNRADFSQYVQELDELTDFLMTLASIDPSSSVKLLGEENEFIRTALHLHAEMQRRIETLFDNAIIRFPEND